MNQQPMPREGRAIQECPICGATQPLSSRTCSICGAVLPGERTPVVPMPTIERAEVGRGGSRYDPALGDDDLYAGELGGRMWRWLIGTGIVVALVVGVAIGVVISHLTGSNGDDSGGITVEDLDHSQTPPSPTLVEMSGTGQPTIPPTATPRGVGTPTVDMLALPTVTPLPPTATATATPGPCYQTAQTGDTVLGMAMRCGHRDMSVIETILDLNNMQSAEGLQLGQTLEIPWPTATPGGEPTGEATPVADTGSVPPSDGAGGDAAAGLSDETADEMVYNAFGTPDALAYYQNVEPTLRPGLAWHDVIAGDTIMGIAYAYETDVETLSQINPEVTFRQCDYGLQYGGENCSVILYEGQQLRVPVPIPTMTSTPTPYGTFTPTPTATATYNAPYPLKPVDGARFMADEIVTLRWGATGTLGGEDQYIVRVRDMEADEQHIAFVSATSYQLPGGWQPADGERHTFEWTISVGTVGANQRVLSDDHLTEPRRFTWESR